MTEHALARKRPAGIDSVKPSNERTLFPNFNAVCMTLLMKFAIRPYHLRGNPGTRFSFALDIRARDDHRFKRLINSELKTHLSLHSCEAARNVKFLKVEDGSLLRAAPR